MSSNSNSLTFLLPVAEAVALIKYAKDQRGWDILPKEAVREPFLLGISRNNHLEYATRAVVAAFALTGLAYLGRWRDIVDANGWIRVLHGGELVAAVDGMHALLATLQAHPGRCGALIYSRTDPDLEPELALDVQEALAEPAPPAFQEARLYYDDRSHWDDGDHAGSLVAFLRAHVKLLQEALERDVAAVYGVWI